MGCPNGVVLMSGGVVFFVLGMCFLWLVIYVRDAKKPAAVITAVLLLISVGFFCGVKYCAEDTCELQQTVESTERR